MTELNTSKNGNQFSYFPENVGKVNLGNRIWFVASLNAAGDTDGVAAIIFFDGAMEFMSFNLAKIDNSKNVS